ncbi:unnamed protein product [Amoebophrya sp. A120]|nr:unnamed protein product [Amoebophrya sp. A120]CAD7965652.1 unnamed protein product [Amoebophrya sp. A120]|eukprot:GSA120T00007476001.1
MWICSACYGFCSGVLHCPPGVDGFANAIGYARPPGRASHEDGGFCFAWGPGGGGVGRSPLRKLGAACLTQPQ